MDHSTKIAPSTEGSNSSRPSRCHRCGTPSTARPYRAKQGCTGLTQLELGPATRLRRHILLLCHTSRLPNAEFAQDVLEVSEATFYRWMAGAHIRTKQAVRIRNILAVHRDGNTTHIVKRTRAESLHWNTMTLRRQAKRADDARSLNLSLLAHMREKMRDCARAS